MKSLNIGKILGIEAKLHYTFIIFIIALIAYIAILSPKNLFSSIIWIAMLFGTVFFHELCHSIIAIKKGFKVKEIILLPIGGIAVSEEFPEKPRDEFLIAIAGPLFNFAIVAIILLIGTIFPSTMPSEAMILKAKSIEDLVIQFPLFALMLINFMLGAFNLLIPAIPMDGGRVLRSALAWKLGNLKATRIASNISMLIAIAMFAIAIFIRTINSIMLIFIAFIIYMGAMFEAKNAETKETLKGITLKGLPKKTIEMKPNDTIEIVFEKMKKNQSTIAIMKQKNSIIAISTITLEKIRKNEWKTTKAASRAEELPKIQETELAEKALQLMANKKTNSLAVYNKQKFIGIITEQQLSNLIEISRLEKTQ